MSHTVIHEICKIWKELAELKEESGPAGVDGFFTSRSQGPAGVDGVDDTTGSQGPAGVDGVDGIQQALKDQQVWME
jgi:hypothetical protein